MVMVRQDAKHLKGTPGIGLFHRSSFLTFITLFVFLEDLSQFFVFVMDSAVDVDVDVVVVVVVVVVVDVVVVIVVVGVFYHFAQMKTK